MLVEWSDSYSVGISKFDEQHKKLFQMTNTLFEGIRQNKKKEAMDEVLDGLVAYTVTHFSAEEEIMVRHGFSGYDSHKAEHDQLVSRVKEFHAQYHSGTALLTTEVLGFVVEWLKNHIAKTDKSYSSYLIERGMG